MTEQTKTDSLCPDYSRDATRYPLRNWWQPSWLFNQDMGLPLFSLAPGDLRLVDWLQRRAAASSWPGYMHSPLVVPYVPGTMHHPCPKMSKAETAGLPEIGKEQYKWRAYLDMVHFSPSEITLRISDGFLEVGGKHEERPNEHGFITRCFTRKYRLPIGTDVTKITSTLSGDGVLCVEGPLHESSIPADIVIPIQVEKETAEEQGEEDKNREETPERDTESRDDQQTTPKAPEAPEFLSAEPTTEAPESSSIEPITEAPESSSIEPITEASESSSIEPITEAPESSSIEPITEASESSSIEPITEASESSSIEPITEAPESSSEPITEAPESSSTEPTTEAPESSSTEPITEAPESSSTEPTTEAPESSSTEPTTEAPAPESSSEPITEAPESSSEPITEAPDHGEESPLEPSGEEAPPGSTTVGLQQHEEGKEQEEETHGEPTGESHQELEAPETEQDHTE